MTRLASKSRVSAGRPRMRFKRLVPDRRLSHQGGERLTSVAEGRSGVPLFADNPLRARDHIPPNSLTAIIHIVIAISVSSMRQDDGLAKIGRSHVAA